MAVRAHVAVLADADIEAGLGAAERLSKNVEEPGRILSNELRDFRRRHGEQLAPARDSLFELSGLEPIERIVQRAVA